MALPAEVEAGLDLKQAHSVQFDGDVAWSFAGWLRRTRGQVATLTAHKQVNSRLRSGRTKFRNAILAVADQFGRIRAWRTKAMFVKFSSTSPNSAGRFFSC
jgi:hypothetical protein